MAENSFDIVSKVDVQEVSNAIQQALKEVHTRFDLKDSKSSITMEGKEAIVIHCRPSADSENAWDDCLALLREHWAASGLGGILHCFTGSQAHARAALEMGFLISFAGNVTFAKAENIRQAARELPLDRMLIETDSPFLAPAPHRGKRNEPAFVAQVAAKIAELRGLTPEEVGQATRQNFRSFFKL